VGTRVSCALVDPPGLTLPTEDWDRITLDEHPQADLRGRPSHPLELWPQGRHLLQGHLDWPLRIGGLCQVDARFRCTDYGGPELHICPQRVLQRFFGFREAHQQERLQEGSRDCRCCHGSQRDPAVRQDGQDSWRGHPEEHRDHRQ